MFFSILGAFYPRYDLADLWTQYWFIKILIFIVFWWIAPWVYNCLDGRLKNNKSR